MGLFKPLSGTVRVLIISADMPAVLQMLSDHGIILTGLTYIDMLQIRACLNKYDLRQAERLLKRCGAKLRVEEKNGFIWSLAGLVRRPLLVLGMLIFLAAALYVPSRVFFVRVEGNVTIPEQLILEKAEQCGIVFGASRREVRSEQIKNALISAIPQLQWAGINTSGCVATISVREKSLADAEAEERSSVESVVADRDGIIQSIVVQKGTVLCSVGQAVKEGQVLVSGYTDCGIIIQATKAEAEIFARTARNLQVVSPAICTVRGNVIKEECKHSLRIGKKLINFYEDSGISDTSCVKMYEEDFWSLPGGFDLPISFVTERWIYYEAEPSQMQQEEAFVWMETYAQNYLTKQMIAGKILQADASLRTNENVCVLDAQYACLEMIGKNKAEETLLYDGENE